MHSDSYCLLHPAEFKVEYDLKVLKVKVTSLSVFQRL